jgi:hypothetical protein
LLASKCFGWRLNCSGNVFITGQPKLFSLNNV